MTIDEAIKHCLEVAEENDLAAGTYEILAENNHNAYERLTAETNSSRCAECAADHRQLAEWLTELKELRNSLGAVKLSNMKEALELIRDYKAEVMSAKHGRWLEHHAIWIDQPEIEGWFVQAKCSECERWAHVMNPYTKSVGYECCPHCGARMIKDGDTNG